LRKGKAIRTNNHKDSQGTSSWGGGHGDGENEKQHSYTSYGAPRGQTIHIPNIRMRRLVAPCNRKKVNYLDSSGTYRVRKERTRNPKRIGGGDRLDYRFHTDFHQNFYESAIFAKDIPIARSQFIDWTYMEGLNDLAVNEVIEACKAKNVYRIMGFEHSWNKEIIAQFYATCYFDVKENVKRVHWMTEGTWYGITIDDFARFLGFSNDDLNLIRIHIKGSISKGEMAPMYQRLELVNYGHTHDMLPFYGYLNRLFRKTIAPREGDATRVTSFARNLLQAMDPSAPPFSVIDYIWEEMKEISNSPQKCCGYAPYLMHVIEQVIEFQTDYDFVNKP
jgi:hypothetical protein